VQRGNVLSNGEGNLQPPIGGFPTYDAVNAVYVRFIGLPQVGSENSAPPLALRQKRSTYRQACRAANISMQSLIVRFVNKVIIKDDRYAKLSQLP
jgi:hypothetical protein